MNPYLAITQMKQVTPDQSCFIYTLTHFLIIPWIILKQFPALYYFMCKYVQHITLIFNDCKIAMIGKKTKHTFSFLNCYTFVFSNFSLLKMTL